MRRTKVIVVVDVEIDDNCSDQDIADLYNRALQTIDDNIVHNLVAYEYDKDRETFNELLDEVKTDFQYGDYREW